MSVAENLSDIIKENLFRNRYGNLSICCHEIFDNVFLKTPRIEPSITCNIKDKIKDVAHLFPVIQSIGEKGRWCPEERAESNLKIDSRHSFS